MIIKLCLSLLIMILMSGCSSSNNTNTNNNVESQNNEVEEMVLTVALTSGTSTTDVFEVAQNVLQEKGYTVETTVFNDFQAPNAAVSEGQVDFNFYQHLPFLEQYNTEKKENLVPVGDGIYTVNFGIFSSSLDSLDEVEEGMKVAIQNDNSNRKIALEILQDNDFITLREGVDMPTLTDIESNPLNLEFIELEETVIPSSIEDVDFATCSVSQYAASDRNLEQEILFNTPVESSTIYLVTRPEMEDSKEAKIIHDALTSDEVKQYVEREFENIATTEF